MSHFAGYLQKNIAPGDPAPADAEQRVRRAMSRHPQSELEEMRHGPFWCLVLPVAPWPADPIAGRAGGALGFVAGDPLWVTGDDGAALRPEGSAAAVIDALAAARPLDLQAVQGMFAAVAWNPDSATLALATDKLANRCLYYCEEGARLLFATSLRLLRLLRSEPERVDDQGFAEFLYIGQSLGRRTLFDGVSVLRPGECLLYRRPTGAVLESYDDIRLRPRLAMSRDEAITRLHGVFSRAVRRRLGGSAQEAFLSGGMDSRSVVAELVDQGHSVRTFSASYAGSVDDVVAQHIARTLGTRHHSWQRSPADRVRVALDPFALYARDHFPAECEDAGRALWSGDGGSVVLGHVYMDEARCALAEQPPTVDLMKQLFPGLDRRRTRHFSDARQRHLSELVLKGLVEEFERNQAAPPDRRLFLYYLQNDQTRHLYHHFEAIDVSRVELLTPFFDSEFVSLVMGLPTQWFLRHGLYNDWIRGFRCGAGNAYWQSYPGHLPCPHPQPIATDDQWNPRWYENGEVRRSYRRMIEELIDCNDPLATPYLSKPLLRVARLVSLAGSSRLDYEVSNARDIVGALRLPPS